MMYNFNHERWFIIAGFIAQMRYVIEECFKWAHQRKVGGKTLIQSEVIRMKMAKMIRYGLFALNCLPSTVCPVLIR